MSRLASTLKGATVCVIGATSGLALLCYLRRRNTPALLDTTALGGLQMRTRQGSSEPVEDIEDLDAEISQVMARSFADSNQGFNWALGPRWALPGDPDIHQRPGAPEFSLRVSREKHIGYFLDWQMRSSLIRGTGAVLYMRKPDGKLGGAVVFEIRSSAGGGPLNWLCECVVNLQTMWAMGAPPCIARGVLQDKLIMERMDIMEGLMQELHHAHAPGKHLYVAVVAVDPDSHGQGICSQMMRCLSQIADSAELPCYLETDSEFNRSVYKRYGYEVVEDREMKRADSDEEGVHLCAMVREKQC